MTAAELIEQLKNLPPETIVIVTDPNCCGCAPGPIDDVRYDKEDGSVFLGGDKWKRAKTQR